MTRVLNPVPRPTSGRVNDEDGMRACHIAYHSLKMANSSRQIITAIMYVAGTKSYYHRFCFPGHESRLFHIPH